jgi:hypothetical protein
MRFLYLTIKFFPYWAIPAALILTESAIIMRRRANHKGFLRLATAASFLYILTILYFVFRWDMTLFPVIRDHFLVSPP